MEEKTLAIQTSNLSFSFNEEVVLNDINIQVEQGAIYGFLGANGAGKTTTIRLILGLLNPSDGQVSVLGQKFPKQQLSILSDIGSLIEQPSLYEHLSGYDNLRITADYRNVSYKRIPEVLELLNLSDAANKLVGKYSLGMKQRLGIALALLAEPKLLILDEPVNGLDPAGIIETRELLLLLNKKLGVTIFLSSHLLAEIEKLVTHVGIIHKGKLMFQGTISDLLQTNKKASLVRITTKDLQHAYEVVKLQFPRAELSGEFLTVPYEDLSQVAAITKLLVENNALVYHLDIWTKELEQMFMEITENI